MDVFDTEFEDIGKPSKEEPKKEEKDEEVGKPTLLLFAFFRYRES